MSNRYMVELQSVLEKRSKITEEWRYSLCTVSGLTFAWLGWPRKMAIPSPVGDVKIVSPIYYLRVKYNGCLYTRLLSKTWELLSFINQKFVCEGLSKISSNSTLHLIKVGKLKRFKKVSSDLKTILMTDLADLRFCGFLSFGKITWSKKESVVCEALFYLK